MSVASENATFRTCDEPWYLVDRAGKDSTEGPVAFAQKVLDLDSRWDRTSQGLGSQLAQRVRIKDKVQGRPDTHKH